MTPRTIINNISLTREMHDFLYWEKLEKYFYFVRLTQQVANILDLGKCTQLLINVAMVLTCYEQMLTLKRIYQEE